MLNPCQITEAPIRELADSRCELLTYEKENFPSLARLERLRQSCGDSYDRSGRDVNYLYISKSTGQFIT